jgi:hypothetical protein
MLRPPYSWERTHIPIELENLCFPEMVWMMWPAVFFLFLWSVHSGMCSTSRWSTEYVSKSWPGPSYPFRWWTVESIIQCDVASISKTEFYCWGINSRLFVQWGNMIAYVESARSCFAPVLHMLGMPLRLNCYVSLQTDQAFTCICTSMWVAINNFCCNWNKYEKCVML